MQAVWGRTPQYSVAIPMRRYADADYPGATPLFGTNAEAAV